MKPWIIIKKEQTIKVDPCSMICEIAKLEMGPNDILLIRARQGMSGEVAHQVEKRLTELMPGVRFVLCHNLDFSVVSKKE